MDAGLEKHTVPGRFDDVAGSYDLLTGANPGYHKHLRWSADRLVASVPGASNLLDLCCGTGSSTRALRGAAPNATITAVDRSEGMLEVARKKTDIRATFLAGDAMDPAATAPGPYDGVLMAYGIRNMPDADLCLDRLFQLLKPGGTLAFHEYSVADSAWARWRWSAVSWGIIIPSGFVFSPRSNIYTYLWRSVLTFDGVEAFEARLRRHGFVDVRTEPMDGWQRGVLHTFLARRPA
jgi:ubiquinone/menaquinone biosynthesis C-methylase UbiE